MASKKTTLIPMKELPRTPDHLMDKAQALFDELTLPDQELFASMKKIHAFMDDFNQFVATFTTCARGCNHCCRIDVHISTLEAEYIAVNTGAAYRNAGRPSFNHTSPCPFLKASGECGIYAFRPMVCRTFHAVGDPDNCAPGRVQHQYGTAQINYSNRIYSELMKWVHFQNSCVPHTTMADIRDFFPQRYEV